MTKEELEKEAVTECFMLTVNTIGIDQRDVELAYVMGAEPREKRIAELEKENAELKAEVNRLKLNEQLAVNNGKNLLKENTELKDALKGKRCNCMTYLNFKDLEKECAKAKEIIKTYYEDNFDEAEFYSFRRKVENFLKGE